MPRVQKIQLRRGSTAPTAADFVEGEPAWDSSGKQLYVKAADGTMAPVGGGGSGAYTVSSTAPSSPTAGDRWLDSDNGIEYTYVNDGDSSQWVQTPAVDAAGVIAATAPLTYDSGSQTVSTSMATGKLLGRSTAGTGVAEEISIGSGLSLSAGSLTATGSAANYQEFTSSGTWTKPAGVTFLYVECVSGGGGGGSGQRGAAGTIRGGGAGGAGGKFVSRWMPASLAGSTETITVGSGGVGGAARTTDQNGANGGTGGSSSFGSLLITPATGGGNPGTNAGATGTTNSYYGTSTTGLYAGNGGQASGTGTGGSSGGRGALGPGGGAGGGGITSADSANAGGVGGQGFSEQKNSAATQTTGSGGGVQGSANGGVGGNGTTYGDGGGGGGGASTTNAGAGGNGAVPGGGGGGGGAATGFNSGKGGDGGAGYVRIWAW